MTLRTSAAGQHVRQYPLSRVACFALAASLTVGAACAFHRENGFDEDFSDSVRNGVVSIGLDVAGNGGTNQYPYRQ